MHLRCRWIRGQGILVALCSSVVTSVAAGQQSEPPSTIVVDAAKIEVNSVVRASLDLAPTLAPSQVIVYAPAGTDVWVDGAGKCEGNDKRERTATLAAAKLASAVCWRAEREQTARLLAQLDLPDGRKKWISGSTVEFYAAAELIDRSFWAGVISTILGAIIAGTGAWMQLVYQDRKERAKSKREQDASKQKERMERRLDAQKFLATEFLPSISGWRKILEAWDPASNVPPRKVNVGGTYSTQEQQRAAQLAEYFADADQSQLVGSIKELHALATSYDDLTDAINIPAPSHPDDQAELAEKTAEAVEKRKRLLRALAAIGF